VKALLRFVFDYTRNVEQVKSSRFIPTLMQDHLAGVGSSCAHRSYESDACISRGQMHVPCCAVSDSGNQSCGYRPGLVTGVLCCLQSGTASLVTSIWRFTCTL